MPLRDHFHFPANKGAKWDRVHGAWPTKILDRLNTVLPPRYVAAPLAHVGSMYEIDIAAFEGDGDDAGRMTESGGGVATAPAVWAPPAGTLTVSADWSAVDAYEVRVYDAEQEQELVAAIEIVSPSNKDRPETRRLFVNKCAGLLQAGVSVVVVDVVTNRTANLYAELLAAVNQSDPAVGDPPHGLYAAALRTRAARQGEAMETWYHSLAIGQPLPTLPVWLTERLAVPLELEPIYEETLRALRIA
ncbi:MAG: DUF4058 family protein [Fimbriiglobus sp.]